MNKRWPDKIVIGLTGNIATGKSAVMQMAAAEGALTLDADRVVHEILEKDPDMQAAIAVAFGPEVRRPDGTIDRAALGSIVFSDEEALRDLEQMVHPAVRRQIQDKIDATSVRVVMIEAIKLLEGKLAEMVDQVWVTRAPRKVQIERLMVCRGMDAETAVMRVEAQNPQEAKVAWADVVIDTHGTMADTRAQFELAWDRLPAAVTEKPSRRRQPVPVEPLPSPVSQEPSGPAAQPDPVPEPEPAAASKESGAEAVLVRRARPSDIPGILLLIQWATDGQVQMKRAELLMAFGERSYLIGQQDAEIKMVVGWNTNSTTAVAIDQVFVHPLAAVKTAGPAILREIEKSARELICEVSLAYLPSDVPDPIHRLFLDAGYQPRRREEMPRAWQETVSETQPEGTFILAKILRDVRIK